MRTSTLAYRPSFKLSLPIIILTVILLSLLGGCGGSSSGSAAPSTNPGTSAVSLTISAASSEVYAGGAAVSLSASKSQGSGTVNWSLNNTSLGSLSASNGDSIQYIPPSPQSANGASSVTITASIGSVSQSLTLPIRSAARIEFVAGDIGGAGNIDGVGVGARFNLPKNLVVDKDGTIFVCDTGNGLIRKITAAGVVSTLAVFDSPRALTVDRDGKLYVIDGKNNLIRSITPQGVISTLSTQITLKAKAELKDLVVDALGNLYVMENELIHRITKSGELSVFAGKSNELGLSDGKGGNARFTSLEGIVVDKENNLFVLDDVTVRKITPDGQVTTFDTWAGPSGFNMYLVMKGGGIAIDPSGNLFVTRFRADPLTGTSIVLRRISKNGEASILDVQGDPLGSGIAKIAVGSNGKILIADTKNHRFMTMNVQGNSAEVNPFVGQASGGYSAQVGSWYGVIKTIPISQAVPTQIPINSSSAMIRFYSPPKLATTNGELFSYETRTGLVAYTQGYFYVISHDSASRNAISRMSPSGAETVLISFSNLDAAIGLAIDTQDRLYFATTTAVYKFSSESAAVLIAGHAYISEYTDANGTAARFGKISSLHVSRDGSIYVTDKNVLRKIDTSGNVTTIAGRYGEAGVIDGVGTNARLGESGSITSDLSGNIYFAESSSYKLDSTNTYVIGKNHTIRKISPTGAVSTIAGVAGKFGIGLDSFPNTLGPINDIQFVAPNTLYISSEFSVLKINLTN